MGSHISEQCNNSTMPEKMIVPPKPPFRLDATQIKEIFNKCTLGSRQEDGQWSYEEQHSSFKKIENIIKRRGGNNQPPYYIYGLERVMVWEKDEKEHVYIAHYDQDGQLLYQVRKVEDDYAGKKVTSWAENDDVVIKTFEEEKTQNNFKSVQSVKNVDNGAVIRTIYSQNNSYPFNEKTIYFINEQQVAEQEASDAIQQARLEEEKKYPDNLVI